MADQTQYSSPNDKREFIRRQMSWKIPGIILGLVILAASISGIFLSYYYTGPLQLQYGFIDSEGNIIVEPEYESTGQYENNRARFRKEGRYGILDRTGEVIFPPEFTSINQQSEELVSGLIDAELRIMRRGGKLVENVFLEIEDITTFPIRVKTEEGWGLLNSDGSYLLEPGFDSLEPFDEKNIAIFSRAGHYGLVNREGTIVLEADYDGLELIDEELVWLNREGLYGLARAGEVLIEPRYNEREPFSENLAAVREDNLWGFINKEGKIVVEPQFETVSSFSEGRARIGTIKE